tara:strand:+ start:212 stop:985 length:774 start_codon:yes stop_codon:yes gene_type:complete
MTEVILSTKKLTKTFGGFRALENLSIEIQAGSITGLIGPNGAGKSTLFQTLTGIFPPTEGQFFFKSKEITNFRTNKLFKMGLAFTFQLPRPFRKMSVLENVMISPIDQIGERITGPFFQKKKMKREEAQIRERAMQILEFITLDHLVNQAAGKISGGQMKLLELARVLMVKPSMILLDEPAAGVSPNLTELLMEKIIELNRMGTTFLIIEHNMDFIMKCCDPVIAMAEGEVIFEGTPAEAQRNTLLLEAYLGAALNG